jgi:hypothetical protein
MKIAQLVYALVGFFIVAFSKLLAKVTGVIQAANLKKEPRLYSISKAK